MPTKKRVVSKIQTANECRLATENLAELKQLIKYMTVTLIPRIQELEEAVKVMQEESEAREMTRKKPKFVLAISGSDDSDDDNDGYAY